MPRETHLGRCHVASARWRCGDECRHDRRPEKSTRDCGASSSRRVTAQAWIPAAARNDLCCLCRDGCGLPSGGCRYRRLVNACPIHANDDAKESSQFRQDGLSHIGFECLRIALRTTSTPALLAAQDRLQVNGVCPGMATGGTGNGPHSSFSGTRISLELSACSQLTTLPV